MHYAPFTITTIITHAFLSMKQANIFAHQHELMRIPGNKNHIENAVTQLKVRPIIFQSGGLSEHDIVSALKLAIGSVDISSIPMAVQTELEAFYWNSILNPARTINQVQKDFDQMMQYFSFHRYSDIYNLLDQYFVFLAHLSQKSQMQNAHEIASVAIGPVLNGIFQKAYLESIKQLQNPLSINDHLQCVYEKFGGIISIYQHQLECEQRLQAIQEQSNPFAEPLDTPVPVTPAFDAMSSFEPDVTDSVDASLYTKIAPERA